MRWPFFALVFVVEVVAGLEKLIFVQTYFRHGDRTPVQPIRSSSFNAAFYGNQLGELTPIGMKEGILLGRRMKKRYVTSGLLLNESFLNMKEIYMRSTDINRTLETATAFVAGMFDYGKKGKDFPDVPDWKPNWTPVPVHTSAMITDFEGNPFPLCPRAAELDSLQVQSETFKNLIRDHQEFCDRLRNLAGEKVSIKEGVSVYGLLDALLLLKKHGHPLPTWANATVLGRLSTISSEQLMLKFGEIGGQGSNLIRLRGGNKIKMLLSRLQEKWNCFARRNDSRNCQWYSRLRFYGFATHDMTLWGMLTPFGIVEKVFGKHHEIDHAASLTFELWNVDGRPMINFVFLKNPNLSEEFQSITHLIEGCPPQGNNFCPFENVLAAVKNHFPNDIAEECKARNIGRSKRSSDLPKLEAFFDGRVW
ncbi:hypothetical protein L596_011594 [Steinernema carpocapsae]|uniref:acid phosphatase n=1 Tax=Steinernema carpocapsae TaxID=34508 RepID=A0A4U5NUU9_STECR|nr:hypothetical protein L596_011594 [Steinernema carpocapsae]